MLRTGLGRAGTGLFPAMLAALALFGACGGSSTDEAPCRSSGKCGDFEAPAGASGVGGAGAGGTGAGGVGAAGAGAGGTSFDGGSICRGGETRACAGPAACIGVQTCLDEEIGFGPCVCGVGGTGGSGATGGSSGAVGGAFGIGPIDSGVIDGPLACQGASTEAVRVERDMFLLLDQSSSMAANGGNRWTFVTNGIIDALSSPELMGVGLGLGYFGLHPPGSPPADPAAPGSCIASDYARPDVPIQALPAGGAEITASLRGHTPGGGTPTQPALQGSMQYVVQWTAAHPTRRTAVVLATDGLPEGCFGNDLATVAQVASVGRAYYPEVLTYVIALGGVQGLDQIAQAGGTNQALVIGDSNARQQVSDALKQISARIAPCEFKLPPSGGRPLDFSSVNIHHRPVGGGVRALYYVGSLPDCSATTGGWYYTRGPIESTSIELCPASCDAVSSGGTVNIVVGCASLIEPKESVVFSIGP